MIMIDRADEWYVHWKQGVITTGLLNPFNEKIVSIGLESLRG